MTDIASLEAQAAQLAEQIKAAKANARTDAINRINVLRAEIKALEVAHNLTPDPANMPPEVKGKVARASGVKGVAIAPKYRSPAGETWTGRGLQPRWLVAAMAAGATLESFRIAV